ncbi:Toll/interleukin-1 receptor domain-containing protein [Tanacetum coccineum]
MASSSSSLRAGLDTFRDNEEIVRGRELKPDIERAIMQSRSFIVVLSEKYANSRWCLDELVLILEQRRNFNCFVLPVFYHVDPSHVRNQTGSFAIQGSQWTQDNVNRRKGALNDIANLTGIVVSGHGLKMQRSETDSIAKVVDTIKCELDLKLVSTPPHLTGIETRAEIINSWLKDDQSSYDVHAICGMGGSETTSHRHFRGKERKISSVSEGTHKIEKVLQMKRVLIVLDDIDDQDELSPLLGTKTFHTQSKIIITTRLLDVKSWFGSISWRYRVHKLELLNDYESLELISSRAFGSKKPMEGFEDLALLLAKYCEGNPLALKVLGSSLYVSAEDPCHRELFLHIACFFVGDHIDDVVTILEDDCYAKSGIMTLINRCLLTIAPSKTFVMHQLLQDMGRMIICEESKDPAKRSRVWCSDEAYHLLREGDGSKVIEGLALKTGKLKEGTKVNQ